MHSSALQCDDRDHARFNREGCGRESQQFRNARAGEGEEHAEEGLLDLQPVDHGQHPAALFAIDIFALPASAVETCFAIPKNALTARYLSRQKVARKIPIRFKQLVEFERSH